MTALTIVVPVYQVEDTLERCLSSIADQTFRDWEAILVDDGSTDGSPAMCDEWARRDSRFRVIHQENGGLSDARNAGMAHARSPYITFVDSDDYLAPDTYMTFMRQLAEHPEYDILEFSYCRLDTKGVRTDMPLPDRTYHDMQQYWLEGMAYRHSYAWNKIYRTALFDDVKFPKGAVYEDVYTLPLLLTRAQTVATTSAGWYCYTENPNGITALSQGKEWGDLLDAHLKAHSTLQLPGQPKGASGKMYYAHLLNIQLFHYMLSKQPPRLPQVRLSQLPATMTSNEKIKVRLNNILGIKNLCKLFRAIHQLLPSR